jgi:hypothetical protein
VVHRASQSLDPLRPRIRLPLRDELGRIPHHRPRSPPSRRSGLGLGSCLERRKEKRRECCGGPKGRNITAQGNALGYEWISNRVALKGRNTPRWFNPKRTVRHVRFGIVAEILGILLGTSTSYDVPAVSRYIVSRFRVAIALWKTLHSRSAN